MMPLTRLALVAFALLATSVPDALAQEPRAVPTLVRVLLPGGQLAGGARVLAVSSPEPELAHARPFEIVKGTADERGTVRLRLPDARLWAMWAVLDDGKKRFATELAFDVQPGRAAVLRLEPFPVPFVRIVGLADWKAAVQGKLGLRFTAEGRFGVHLPVPLPEGEDPIVRLPDLPLGNYFPALVDGQGRTLDFTYFSPEFHEDDAEVEPLYERDHPLKRAVLGAPKKHSYRITDSKGQPVPGAVVRLDYSLPLQDGSVWRSDDEGLVRLVLPLRAEAVRARYNISAFVWAPGRWPTEKSLEILPEPPEEPDEIPCRKVGRPLELSLDKLRAASGLALGPGTRFYVSSQWQLGRSRIGPTPRFPLFVDGEGRLQMPALPLSDIGFDLWIADTRRLQPLYSGTPEGLLDTKEEALGKLVPVEVRVTRPGGGRPMAVRMVASSEGREGETFGSRVFEQALDRSGRTLLHLPVGAWAIYLRSPRDGDVLARFDISADDISADKAPAPIDLELAPFRELRGRVLNADDKGRARGRGHRSAAELQSEAPATPAAPAACQPQRDDGRLRTLPGEGVVTCAADARLVQPRDRRALLPRDGAGGLGAERGPGSHAAADELIRYQRISDAPQLRPPPKATVQTSCPGCSLPDRDASSSATGTDAADVLPKRSTLTMTRSFGIPRRSAAESMIRKLAWWGISQSRSPVS